MKQLPEEALDAITAELAQVVKDAAGDAASYASEFAAFMATLAADAIVDPDESRLERMKALALTFTETIEEMSDQVARDVTGRVLEFIRHLIIVARAAAALTAA